MTETEGKWYAVDGESFAHGKVRDITVTYEYDDVYEAIIETLEEDIYNTTFKLGENIEEVSDFLGGDYVDYIVRAYDEDLIDDDYGSVKQLAVLEDCVTDLIIDDAEVEYEGQEFR